MNIICSDSISDKHNYLPCPHCGDMHTKRIKPNQMSHDIRKLNNFVWTCMTRGMCCKHFRHRDNNKREFWNRKLHEGCYIIHMHVHQYLAVCGLQNKNRDDCKLYELQCLVGYILKIIPTAVTEWMRMCRPCTAPLLHMIHHRLPLLKVSDDPVLQCQLHARHVLCKQCVIGATKT